jgi:type IV pilus assembly protein PilA
MLKVQRNSKGFTLIELLIVIAIIGILAAIAIPAYTGYTRKAKVQEVIHAMGAVKTAVMAYYTESGQPPTTASATDIMGRLGVDVPTKYLGGPTGMSVTAGVIQASFCSTASATCTPIGGDVSGSTASLTPDSTYKNWTWGGSLPATYMPKN